MDCGKQIPLELKEIEARQIKTYLGVIQGKDAVKGIFTNPYLLVDIRLYSSEYFLQWCQVLILWKSLAFNNAVLLSEIQPLWFNVLEDAVASTSQH